MTKKIAVCLAMSMLIMVAVFVGCNDGGEAQDAPYTVTFVAEGGGVTPTTLITGEDGKLASWPLLADPNPAMNYTFEGWF